MSTEALTSEEGTSQGFPRAVTPVGVFSRGTTRISGSLSCGSREVMSPCTWREGARHCSRVMGADQGLDAVKVTLTAGRTGTDSGGPGTRRVTTASPSGEPTLPQGLPPTPAPHCWWETSQAGHLSPRKTSLSCAEWGGPRVLPTRAPSAFPLRGGDASRWSFLQLHPARAPASPPATTMQVQLRREAGVRFFLLFMPFATKLSVSKYEKKNLNGL